MTARNPNVSMRIMLDEDQRSLLLIDDNGNYYHFSASPHSAQSIVDFLRLTEKRQPADEQPNQTWHEADSAGRLTAHKETVEDFLTRGGEIQVIKKAKKGFQPHTPEQRASSLKKQIGEMSTEHRAAILAMLMQEEE